MLCLPGGGGCGAQTEVAPRASLRHVRHVSPISRTSDVTKNPNSPPTAQGFLSLLGECAPIGPAQQLQKLPSFYGWNLNFTTSCFLTLFLFQACSGSSCSCNFGLHASSCFSGALASFTFPQSVISVRLSTQNRSHKTRARCLNNCKQPRIEAEL